MPGETRVPAPGSVVADRGGIAINQLHYQPRAVAGRPVRLPPEPTTLVGREELLAELETRLAGNNTTGPRIAVLHGLAGVGKTSVAVEYTYRHLAEVGVAWQLATEDPAALAAGFGELAAQLGAKDLLDPRDTVASVHSMLAAYPAEWLLVFDNAPDQASVEAFLPPAGRGRVLITSQNPSWPPSQVLDVSVLDPEVAAEFLVGRTGDPDRKAALELADELGGLPLALEQAAAYMTAAGKSLDRYLAMFRQRRVDLLARGEPTGYGKTVAATWTLTFERLQLANPAAIGLLRLLACYAPEAIPVDLLQPWPGIGEQLGPLVAPVLVPLLDDELLAGDAIGALRRYSLISPPVDGLVFVHRLVQVVTADQMSAELAGQWRQAAAALIQAGLPDAPGLPEAWPVYAVLRPHAQAVLTADSDGMEEVAAYLDHSGNYAAARAFQQRVLEARERVLDPEHPDILTARSHLAYMTGEAGDAAGARDQLAELVPVFERVLGPEHPDTVAARASLANMTAEAGDPPGARDQLAELVPVFEQVLGPEHPDTLATRANLAYQTGEAGDRAGARDQLAELVPMFERVLGLEQLNTLTAWNNLALWTGMAGDAAGARDQLAELAPVFERVLGPDHPLTLTSRGNFAYWTGEAGDAAGARDLYAELLRVRKDMLGSEHPQTMRAQINLALWTGHAGDPAGARDQYAELVPVVERVLGPEHPEALNTRANLAYMTGDAGDPGGARDQLAELVPVRERVVGREHIDTLATRGHLAYWTGEAGDAAGARDLYAELLPLDERVLGPRHRETQVVRRNLARWKIRARWTRKRRSAAN